MRVRQGHADGLAAVLEREDLLDAGQRRQRGGAVGPGFDDRARSRGGQRAERSFVLRAEADDLATSDRGAGAAEAGGVEIFEAARRIDGRRGVAVRPAQGGAERGRLVLEHRDVVVRGNLGWVRRGLRRQRVEVCGRQEGAVLARCRDRHPVAGEHVAAHGRGFRTGAQVSGIDGAIGTEGGAGVVVVDQFATVGEVRGSLHDAGAEFLRPQVCSRQHASNQLMITST